MKLATQNLVGYLGFAVLVVAAYNLNVLPAPRSWNASHTSSFSLGPGTELAITVDDLFKDFADSDSLTLIPPTLSEFLGTFSEDLKERLGVDATIVVASKVPVTGIWVTITPNITALGDGSNTSEGYRIVASDTLISIAAAGARGAFWGTRTILQAAELNDGVFPAGDILDAPDYVTRGHMLDCGRHWYSPAYLTEMCSLLSYWKMSEFHIHLSDELYPYDVSRWPEYYARFRLYTENSAFDGLALRNESYDFETFSKLQKDCAARGVTVVPEIEAPGHASPITLWQASKGNVIYRSDDPTLLNLTNPLATQVMLDIWEEFLPWFQTKEVSIGADEYPSTLADDYITFVNRLNGFIGASGRAIRAWVRSNPAFGGSKRFADFAVVRQGTDEPSDTLAIDKNVTIQHWAMFASDPYNIVNNGYPIINSCDWCFYAVIKYSTSYPPPINISRLFNFGDPSTGLTWNTSLFDFRDIANNPVWNSPLLKGTIAPVWNDNGPAASLDLEHYYEAHSQIAASGALSWGANGLTQDVFEATYPVLTITAPAQNLDRSIVTAASTIISYRFDTDHLTDKSGNAYDAKTEGTVASTPSGLVLADGSAIITPLGSKGLNHTYTLTFNLFSPSAILRLSGPDSTITFQTGQAPTYLGSNNFAYPLRDPATRAVVPLFLDNTTSVTIATTEASGTELWIGGARVGNFDTPLSQYLNSNYYAWVRMAFVAPVSRLSVTGGSATVLSWKLEEGYVVE